MWSKQELTPFPGVTNNQGNSVKKKQQIWTPGQL